MKTYWGAAESGGAWKSSLDVALRHGQTLSEATQRLPQELKERHPKINWKGISGFRNILVHS